MAEAKKNVSGAGEWVELAVYFGRCSKVVAGGRRFSFLVVAVVGDGKGRCGIGQGKALELGDAQKKAIENAKKSLVTIPLREGRTLHHDVVASYCATKVVLRAAPPGTGVIAGGPVKALMVALGIKDVVTKVTRPSSNVNNVLKAAFRGLQSVKSPKFIAEKRGKKIGEIISRRDIDTKLGRASDAAMEVAE